MSGELKAIGAVLDPVFAMPFGERLDDTRFNDLALRVFAFQYERNVPYGAWCQRRGRTPGAVSHWTDIPPAPTVAFKEVPLVAGQVGDAEATFRTSGTTSGRDRRGTHHILDLSLYERSLLSSFRAMVLPDGARPAMFGLIPSADEWQDSSLSHMITAVSRHLGSAHSACFASADRGLDTDGLAAALGRAGSDGEAVCLLGTTASFVHILEELAERGARFRLPAGSRLMDTGGSKGRGREITGREMLDRYEEQLGLPESHVVNEYGMTEMCSQFYDTILRDHVVSRSAGVRRKLEPPWVRTRVVDPDTLEPVEAGRTGLLQHFDLANAGSVMAVQTEDLGTAVDDGFRVLGRAVGAPPRGCSIAMDELMAMTSAYGR